jgi:hypothetical protein
LLGETAVICYVAASFIAHFTTESAMSSLIQDSAELQRAIGWNRKTANSKAERSRLRSYIAFQMASAGLLPPIV